MEIEKKYKILEEISRCVPENGSGEDEENILQNFLPLRTYSKLADPKIFLIIGGRGTGKTELFRILTSCGGLNYILSDRDRMRYTKLKESEFLTGYIATGFESKTFPASSVCDDLVRKEKPDNFNSFWGGLVSSVILKRFREDNEINALANGYLGEETKNALAERSSEVSGWWKTLDFQKEKWESFLDKTDTILQRRDIYMYCV